MVRFASIVLAALLVSTSVQSDAALLRVRLIVTTTAGSVGITVEGARLAGFVSRVTSGGPQVHASATGLTIGLSRNVRGETAEAQFDAVLARVAGPEVTWNVKSDVAANTRIEVYSLADAVRPRLVDRFALDTADGRFASPAALLDANGGLRLDRVRPRLVLANFYPWYTTDTWRDSQLADRPLRLYSNDSPQDTLALTRQARDAGIDAFVVSWQGPGPDGDIHDRRLQLVLDAAAASGLHACAFTETALANPDSIWDAPTDPRTMADWIIAILDRFGSHPAYLRVDGRPVVFIYASSNLQEDGWTDVRARLRAAGRDPLLIGDQYQSRLLAFFDGEYQYDNVNWRDPYQDVDDAEGLRTRTFHLLLGDRRRIFVASVTPGYDDSRLAGRPTHLTVDRAGARVYDDMWSAAIGTEADWLIVTSWNEWWENTEIEPSVRYGSLYLDRTRLWSDQFKRDRSDQRIRQPLTGPP